jgi:hypothetical protein
MIEFRAMKTEKGSPSSFLGHSFLDDHCTRIMLVQLTMLPRAQALLVLLFCDQTRALRGGNAPSSCIDAGTNSRLDILAMRLVLGCNVIVVRTAGVLVGWAPRKQAQPISKCWDHSALLRSCAPPTTCEHRALCSALA